MKKLCILLALIMIPASMWALSIENDASFGLFGNEMDAASSVGGGFLDLDKTYIFGGLANIDRNTVVFSPGSATPMIGAFVYGDMPWSAFAKFDHTNQSRRAYPSSDPKPGLGFSVGDTISDLKDIVYDYKGSEDEQWKYIERKADFRNILAEEITDRFQFITVYDGMVVGAYVNYNVDNSDWSTGGQDPYDPFNNYKETLTVNYDKASASASPEATEDYTITSEKTTKNKSTSLSASVPVFIPGDEKDVKISAALAVGGTNESSKFTQEISEPKDPNSDIVTEMGSINSGLVDPVNNAGSTFTNTINDETIDKESSFRISGSYSQSTKSPFFEGTDKDFTIMGSAGIDFETKKYEDYTETQDYDYTKYSNSAVTSKRDPKTYVDDSTIEKYAAKLTLDVSAGASHAFSYELDNGVSYVLKPQASVSLSSGPKDFRLKEIVDVATTDSPADGDLDSKVTTTSTYEGNSSNKTEFGIDLTPTCALQFQPEDKKFGFTLGVQGNIGMTAVFESTKPSVVSINTATWSKATGNTTYSDFYSETQGTSTSYINWDMRAEHRFGMNWDISDNVTLLVDLNSSTSVNLFDFENLIVQALVSLP